MKLLCPSSPIPSLLGIGAASMSHRIPIPERSSLSCFIKVFLKSTSTHCCVFIDVFVQIYTKLDEVKLNEVVEFAGIVDLAENSIPVVHAFHYNKQNHINPLMNEMICIPSAFPSIRDQLLKHITSAVANDHLAAEYLLCNLISSM